MFGLMTKKQLSKGLNAMVDVIVDAVKKHNDEHYDSYIDQIYATIDYLSNRISQLENDKIAAIKHKGKHISSFKKGDMIHRVQPMCNGDRSWMDDPIEFVEIIGDLFFYKYNLLRNEIQSKSLNSDYQYGWELFPAKYAKKYKL